MIVPGPAARQPGLRGALPPAPTLSGVPVVATLPQAHSSGFRVIGGQQAASSQPAAARPAAPAAGPSAHRPLQLRSTAPYSVLTKSVQPASQQAASPSAVAPIPAASATAVRSADAAAGAGPGIAEADAGASAKAIHPTAPSGVADAAQSVGADDPAAGQADTMRFQGARASAGRPLGQWPQREEEAALLRSGSDQAEAAASQQPVPAPAEEAPQLHLGSDQAEDAASQQPVPAPAEDRIQEPHPEQQSGHEPERHPSQEVDLQADGRGHAAGEGCVEEPLLDLRREGQPEQLPAHGLELRSDGRGGAAVGEALPIADRDVGAAALAVHLAPRAGMETRQEVGEVLPEPEEEQAVAHVPDAPAFQPGDTVYVWSVMHQRWFQDGQVQDMATRYRVEDHEGIVRGSIKVAYNAGDSVKWVAPWEDWQVQRPRAPGVGPADAVPDRSLREGDPVRVWSVSRGRWIDDGVVQAVAMEDIEVEGQQLVAGSVLVTYDGAAGVKWVHPGEMLDVLSRPEEPHALAPLQDMADDGAPAGPFQQGDSVHVWSISRDRWVEDGVVQDVAPEDLDIEGELVEAGSVLVTYDGVAGVKWISPAEQELCLRPASGAEAPGEQAEAPLEALQDAAEADAQLALANAPSHMGDLDEACHLRGPHGAFLVRVPGGGLCMDRRPGREGTWRLRPADGEDRHFLVADDGTYLAVANGQEQALFLLELALPRHAVWTVRPTGQDTFFLRSTFNTYLASLEDEEQTLYMSPNCRDWERWRLVPAEGARGDAGALAVGVRVKVVGLQRRVDINGECGTLIAKMGLRWRVAMDSLGEKLFMERNLQVIGGPAALTAEPHRGAEEPAGEPSAAAPHQPHQLHGPGHTEEVAALPPLESAGDVSAEEPQRSQQQDGPDRLGEAAGAGVQPEPAGPRDPQPPADPGQAGRPQLPARAAGPPPPSPSRLPPGSHGLHEERPPAAHRPQGKRPVVSVGCGRLLQFCSGRRA
uniref:Uncharacterized protein n=1 Tax=Alexandrium monilatum TaxID=311494 RepID=A0A7S4Q175_9DINO